MTLIKKEKCNDGLDTLVRDMENDCSNWTDDLPVCKFSALGFATNQLYRIDGNRREEHEFEDRSFHFSLDDDTFLYGVFDGQFGSRAAEFASQRMPAEILLGELKDKESDQEVKDVMQLAFLTVETSFFQSIDNLLAEKEELQSQLQGLRTYEALQKYPNAVQKLNVITSQIETGTTATVALIHKKKLYVANVGNTRALLYQTDHSGTHSFRQLTVDHNFKNKEELYRLSQLGLDVEPLSQNSNERHTSTRCLGNYTVKGGYKDSHNLSNAKEEPILAEPDVFGGIPLDYTCKFLLLMSSGLYESLEQVTGTNDVNGIVIQMVIEQFQEQSTLNGVAQAVVDKVVRIHNDAFMKNNELSKHCQKRNDITLLVRNFNQPLPNSGRDMDATATYRTRTEATLTRPVQEIYDTNDSSTEIFKHNDLNDSFPSSGEPSFSSLDYTRPHLFQPAQGVQLDNEGKIASYVDFTDFFEAIEEAIKSGESVPEEWKKPE